MTDSLECKIDERLSRQRNPVKHVMEEDAKRDADGQAEEESKRLLHLLTEPSASPGIERTDSATRCARRRPPAGDKWTVSPKSAGTKPRFRMDKAWKPAFSSKAAPF